MRRSHVQALIKELEGKGLAAGSVRNIYRVIPFTPCLRITLPRGDVGEVVPLALEQFHAVRNNLDELWRAIPLVLAGSGLRIGELLGLGVYDVDYLRRTIRIERQRLQSGELAPLKSKTSRRTVPVGQVVLDASALISGGASVKQVQTFLGHASAVITLRTYAHMFPGDEDRTRNVLDAALSPAALADSARTEAASE